MGRVDTATGRVTDFTYARSDGLAATSHGIITARDGAVWFNVNLRAPGEPANERLGRIDPRTETLEVFTPPGDMRGMSIHVAEDAQGNIWGDTATGAIRYDPAAGAFTAFTSPTQPGRTYGAAGDRDGNGWWTQIGIDVIGRGDLATGRSSEIRLPARLPSFVQDGDFSREDLAIYAGRGRGLQAPRRPAADLATADVWVPNYAGNNLLRIDVDTLETTYYPLPRAGMNPYMAGVDGDHDVWGQPAGRRRGREAGPRERRVKPLRLALAGHRLAQPGRRGTRRPRGGHRRVLQREPDRSHGHAHAGGGAAGRILSAAHYPGECWRSCQPVIRPLVSGLSGCRETRDRSPRRRRTGKRRTSRPRIFSRGCGGGTGRRSMRWSRGCFPGCGGGRGATAARVRPNLRWPFCWRSTTERRPSVSISGSSRTSWLRSRRTAGRSTPTMSSAGWSRRPGTDDIVRLAGRDVSGRRLLPAGRRRAVNRKMLCRFSRSATDSSDQRSVDRPMPPDRGSVPRP